MNRIDAFNALFGSNQGTTASQEAVDVLADNMRPTSDEEAAMDTEALDNVSDFLDNAAAYLARFPDGKVKTLLQTYLDAHQTKVSPTDIAPKPAVEPPPVPAPSIPVDPMALLTASRPPVQVQPQAAEVGPTKTVDLLPRTTRRPAERGEPGARADLRTGRDRQPRQETRPQGRIQDIPPEPPAPLSPITQELQSMLDDPLWITMRDQLCRAHEAKDQAALFRLRTIAESFKSGANANSGPRRLIGQLMFLLLADLNSGFDTKNPVEFLTRYWS